MAEFKWDPRPWINRRSPWLLIGVSLILSLCGWFFQNDVGFTDDPAVIVYPVTLGETCGAQPDTCKVRALPAVGYRAETTRDEVVLFMQSDHGHMIKYQSCTIWDSHNWDCGPNSVSMVAGIPFNARFPENAYYISRLGWKLASLRVLPVSMVTEANRLRQQ